MSLVFPPVEAREAMLRPEFVGEKTSLVPMSPEHLYLPRSFRKILDWNTCVITGMSGVGKSVLAGALADNPSRYVMAQEWNDSVLLKADVCVGFSQDESGKYFPNRETIEYLLEPFDAFLIFQPVAVKKATGILGGEESTLLNSLSWRTLVAWVKSNQEQADILLLKLDIFLRENTSRLLFVFDSLELRSDDWGKMRKFARGALRFALYLRGMKNIRAKVFLRDDVYEDKELWIFPDSANLKSNRVSLSWSREDLFGLVLKRLDARDLESVIDPYVGRAKTVDWIVNRLADSRGRSGPRSMLELFQAAAAATAEKFPEHRVSIHGKSLAPAMRKVSDEKIEEIMEVYPWKCTHGSVPMEVYPWKCTHGSVPMGWGAAREPRGNCDSRYDGGVAGVIEEMMEIEGLPPRRFTTDGIHRGERHILIKDLEEIGVGKRSAATGKVVFPEIFRIGSRIKRRGGVTAGQRSLGGAAG